MNTPDYQPGRLLDFLVERHVFKTKAPQHIPKYSQRIDAAFLIIEKLNKDCSYVMEAHPEGECSVTFTAGYESSTARGHSLPHAICLAALKFMKIGENKLS